MLIGNLTRDPELRYTPQGTAVCSFGLATNRSWLPSDSSERREETEFHRIVAWNKLAELCSQLLTKGRKVYVEGRLQTRSWETPDGDKRQATEVVAEDMVLLDSKKPVGTVEPEDLTEVVDEEKPKEKEEVKTEAKPEEKKEKEKVTEGAGKANSEEIDVDDIPF
jgi:single-strand DNA-binding protein